MTDHRRVEVLFKGRIPLWRDRVALSLAGRGLTYGDLDARSNRLAQRLIAAGVVRHSIVGVATGDLEGFAVAVLATLKAGGSYLPIDVRYPVDRVRDVLSDATPTLLLADADFPEALIPPSLTVIRDFDKAAVLEPYADDPLPTVGDANDTACIYYTSGSTGRPKGIEVTHRGIPLLVGDPHFLAIQPDDRIAQTANFGFDATALEVWGALLNGACLVQMPTACLFSARDIARFYERERISISFLTTSLFNALTAQDPCAFGGLKHLLIGGEAAEPRSAGRVLDSGSPPGRLINAYGPTEATTFAAWRQITRGDVDSASIPIGRPIRDMVLRVVDEHGAPTPAGEAGELWIGGPGVATGYLNQPALTAERFVTATFDDEASRFYRSGDLCRFREDGALEFLGRLDDQVKIRGFRVEPGDVAAALCKLPGVDDAIVLAREAAFGTRELVGFVIGERLPSMDALRSELARRVPDYMTPVLLRKIGEIPLTPSGKLDRRRLLDSARAGPPAASSDKVEECLQEQVLAIWRAVLRRADVSVDMEFRDLGGDSLSLMNLALEIERAFGRLPTIDELAAPLTVRSLSRYLSHQVLPATPKADLVENASGTHAKVFAVAYPWSLAAAPAVIGEALSGGPWKHLQTPLTAFRGPPPTIGDLAALLRQQLLAAEPTGPYILYGHCFCGLLAYELARQLMDAGHAVDMVVMLDSYPGSAMARPTKPAVVLRRLRHFAVLPWSAKFEALFKKIAPAKPATFDDFIKEACWQASQQFHPAPYLGRLVFFRHNYEPDFALLDQQIWRRLTRGGYSEHVIELHADGKVTDQKLQEGYREMAAILRPMALNAGSRLASENK